MTNPEEPRLTPADPTAAHHPRRVEALQELLGSLLREREAIRGNGADRDELERNRQAIVGAQWELSHALIARYHPGLQPAV